VSAQSDAPAPDVVAAVDLGSNSFHLVVARRIDATHVSIVERRKEQVRLAAGLDHNECIDDETATRALQCLHVFGQQIKALPKGSVRAVGTNTLRRAKNGRAFLDVAGRALGHPIQIISGSEEARLIYLGVAHTVPDEGRRLVVDIGGGSTECILGDGFEVFRGDSLFMGCVTWSLGFFADGGISQKRMESAELAALQEIATIARPFRRRGWARALGSSGTAETIEAILRANGRTTEGITRAGLDWLRDALVDARKVSKIELAGMKPDRKDVLPGGVAIMRAIFEGLDVDRMSISSGALREGLLYDLLGRIRHEDRREQTIRRFQERFHVDQDQASRVLATANRLFADFANKLPKETRDDDATLLGFAARLHEIGLAVSHTGYHKHGAYLLRFADMPGFTRDDQEMLSAVVGGHRRKLLRAPIEAFGAPKSTRVLALTLALRLSALLERSRGGIDVPPTDVHVALHENHIRLAFPPDWLVEHPLTRTDLEMERVLLEKAGLHLEVV